MKYFLLKLKDVGLSMLPILLVVLLLNFCFYSFSSSLLLEFVASVFIITIGEVLFLTGVDSSVMKMGDRVGRSVNKFSKLAVILFFAFIFGLFATVAEPDLSVLSAQASSTWLLNVPKFLFIFVVGAGVGVFVAFALFRIVKNINYKLVMLAIFVFIFIVAIFVPNNLIALAFDTGGATTGIITSPFLLALASGIAKNKSSVSHSDNFGVVGIASTGPILAILLLSLIAGVRGNTVEVANSLDLNIFLDVLINTMLAFLPLVLVYVIFDLCFLKTSKKKKIKMLLGSLITFVGLYLFLFGIDFGMIEMGEEVGLFLASKSPAFVILVSVIIGFLITFTEPAVRVLGAQVESVSQGNIRRVVVTIAIAVSMMLAVSLSSIKIMYNISIWYILGIGYGIILLLMPFSSSTFVAIAFDSGGVASGPMSAAFILPLMIGFASQNGGNVEGFGLIAIVGMMPIFVLEVLGIVYKIKVNANSSRQYKKALRISYGLDMYSNIESLEEAYNRRRQLKEMQEEKSQELEEQIVLAKQLEEIRAIREEDNGKIKG